jgi:hypothetical protein
MHTTRKIEYSDGHLVALEIEPPPLLLLPTVIAAIPTAAAHKQLPTCNPRRLWVYPRRFIFPFSLILCHELIDSENRSTSIHHRSLIQNRSSLKVSELFIPQGSESFN